MIREQLRQFIAIRTIAHDESENATGIDFVMTILGRSGFEVRTIGDSPYHQPVVVGRFRNPKSSQHVVLYGHYDVERIKVSEQWNTPPFELVEAAGRYYCRGIADNKGVLLTRMLAVEEMVSSGESMPNLTWIIQGEEEVGGQTPFAVIPGILEGTHAKLFVEETGIYKDGTPVIFHLPESRPGTFLTSLNEAIYDGVATIEHRSLNKFSKCPFLQNIPSTGHYIGFGPNDSLCNIHRANESLNKELLEHHREVFKRFLRWAASTVID